MRTKIFVLIVMLLLTNSAISSVAEPKITAQNVDDGKFNSSEKSDRIAIAKALTAEINLLDSFVPNPTPDDINWIKAEQAQLKKRFTFERQNNLVNSPEFQEYKLKIYLNDLRGSLACVINSSSVSQEMYCWSLASYFFIDTSTLNDAMTILISNQKIPKNIGEQKSSDAPWTGVMSGSGDDDRYNMAYHGYGEGILHYILAPYLESSSPPPPPISFS